MPIVYKSFSSEMFWLGGSLSPYTDVRSVLILYLILLLLLEIIILLLLKRELVTSFCF